MGESDEPLQAEQVVARAIGVHPATLRRLRQAGKGPRFIRVGRQVRYARSDVDTWLRAQTDRGFAA